jgi:hypothetical protein
MKQFTEHMRNFIHTLISNRPFIVSGHYFIWQITFVTFPVQACAVHIAVMVYVTSKAREVTNAQIYNLIIQYA